jgi:hypothetical protein
MKRVIRKGRKYMKGHSYSNCGNAKGCRFSWTSDLGQTRLFNENDVETAKYLAIQSGGKCEFTARKALKDE